MSFSNWAEAAILNSLFSKTSDLGALGSAPTIHVALCESSPADDDTGSTIVEATYIGYERQETASSDWVGISTASVNLTGSNGGYSRRSNDPTWYVDGAGQSGGFLFVGNSDESGDYSWGFGEVELSGTIAQGETITSATVTLPIGSNNGAPVVIDACTNGSTYPTDEPSLSGLTFSTATVNATLNSSSVEVDIQTILQELVDAGNVTTILLRIRPQNQGSNSGDLTGINFSSVSADIDSLPVIPSTATIENGELIQFPASTGVECTITHFALLDSATDGNLIAYGALDESKTMSVGDSANFQAGSLTITLD